MGAKRLLGTINITDVGATSNDSNVSFITAVQDEDSGVIEVFNRSIDEIDSSDLGYSGEYFNQNYADLEETIYSESSISIHDLFSTENYLWVFDDNNLTGKYYLARVDLANSNNVDFHFELTFTSNTPTPYRGMYVDETNDRVYLPDVINDEIIVSSATSFSEKTTEFFGSGILSNPMEVWIDEATDKAYVGDVGNDMIRVFDISTPTSPSHLSAEDIDLSDYAFFGSLESFVVDTENNRVFVLAQETDPVVRVWRLSDQTYMESENITFSNSVSDDWYLSQFEDFGISDTHFEVLGFQVLNQYKRSNGEFIRSIDLSNGLNEVYHREYNKNYFFAGTGGENIIKYEGDTFPSALVYPIHRNRVSDKVGVFWERKDENYQYIEGTSLVTFKPVPFPPYYLPRKTPLSEINPIDITAVNDLTASIKGYTFASGKRTNDGSVTILATGSNTPFTYQAIGADGRNVDPQSSATFNNLYPGTYRFRVTDSNNVSRDLAPIALPYLTTTFGNYGRMYSHQFESLAYSRSSGSTGMKWRIEIFDRDSSDNNTNISAGSTPAVFNTEGQSQTDIIDVNIIAGSLDVQLISNTLNGYTAFAEADDERFGCILSQYNGSTYDEKWRGFMTPTLYGQEYGATPVLVNLNFEDRLGDLKNLPYAAENDYFLTDTFYGGYKTELDVILFCLKRLNMDLSGLRIAHTLFEENHDSTSTDTPFEQSYVDTDTYFKLGELGNRSVFGVGFSRPVESSMTMAEVIKAILEPYNAVLVAQEQYYWIVDNEEFVSGSNFSYVQYDMDGAQNGVGTKNTTITWGSSSTETDRWRWAGKVGLSLTNIYRDVKLNLSTNIIESGLKEKFYVRNAEHTGAGLSSSLKTFKGYLFEQQNPLRMELRAVDGFLNYQSPFQVLDEEAYWYIKFLGDQDGTLSTASRIVATGNLNFSGNDRINLKIKYKTNIVPENQYSDPKDRRPGTYIVLPWQLKIGGHYYNATSETWSTTAQLNESHITQYAQDLTDEYDIRLRPQGGVDSTYVLSLYAPNCQYCNIIEGSLSSMLTTLKAVSTSSLGDGARLITWDGQIQRFYELLANANSGSEPNVVLPNDYHASTNNLKWTLRADQNRISATGQGFNTETHFKAPEIQFLPNGEDIPDDLFVTQAANKQNKVTLEKTLIHYDIPAGIRNGKSLYYNITQYDGGSGSVNLTPTTSWSKSGGIKRRKQDHYLKWVTRLAKKGRHRISGPIVCDTASSALTVFVDDENDNIRYRPLSASWDLKEDMINGEFIEISRDTVPSDSGFDSGTDSSGSK